MWNIEASPKIKQTKKKKKYVLSFCLFTYFQSIANVKGKRVAEWEEDHITYSVVQGE